MTARMTDSEVVLYRTDDGETAVEVRLDRDTVWLNQAQLAELFERDQSVISRHIRNVFSEGELPRESNMQKMHIAGSNRPVTFHNLDVIISVGYRVKSKRGTQFRQWATRVLREPSHHREHRVHRGNKPMIRDLLCALCVLCGEGLFPATGTP